MAGKYEFEIMSGTASFILSFLLRQRFWCVSDSGLVALDRRIHRDVGAPLVCKIFAELEIVAAGRHLGLPFQLLRPVSEVVAVPGWLRRERGQAQPLPDRLGALHELALRQRDRRIGALERGVDEHGRALAAVARPARPVAGCRVRGPPW